MQTGVINSMGKERITNSETQIKLLLNYFHEFQVTHLGFGSQLYAYSGFPSRGLGWLADILLASRCTKNLQMISQGVISNGELH